MFKLIQTSNIPWWERSSFALALSHKETDDRFYYKRYVTYRPLDPIAKTDTFKTRFTDLQITFTEEETV